MLSPWEAAWVERARSLLSDEEHRDECDRRLGLDAIAAADASDLRWPGYLGSRYRPGHSVLIVATVHREFASGRPPLPAELRDLLVSATRSWRDGALSDEQWLAAVRQTYEAGLGVHWDVGRLIRGLGRRINVDVRDIAYVNAARCQVVESPPLPDRSTIISNVLALCGRGYPIRALVETLSPAALLMSKGTYDCARESLPRALPTFVIDQRQLLLRTEFIGGKTRLPALTRIDEWATVLAQLLAVSHA